MMTAETIAGSLTALARNHPGRLVLAAARRQGLRGNRYEEISAGELERDVNTFAAVLTHHGIRRGMRTVLMIPPGREFCAAVFALLKLGAAPVLIDPGIGLHYIGYAIRQTAPAAFIGIRKADMARRMFGWGRGSIRISLGIDSLSGRLFREHHGIAEEDPAGGWGDEAAAIAFTSGSTGPPKGVVFNHGNLSAQADLVRELVGACASEPHLATFPLLLIFAPVLGVAAVLPDMNTSKPATASPQKLLAASDDYRCRSAFASPVLVRKLGAYCQETGGRFSSIERVFSAGAPSHPDSLAVLEAAIAPGGEIFTPYGATEALTVSNIGSREILRETREKTRRGEGVCVGRPLPGIRIGVIPISDQPIEDWSQVALLKPGEIGELAVSGGVVSREYFNNAEANKLAKIPNRAGGPLFHRMGDLGYFDDHGRLWMCGRKSHRVITPKRVYFTVPVEGVFNDHLAVARTALVGAGTTRAVPVVCVELKASKSSKEKRRIAAELRALGAVHEHTRQIRHFRFHRSFPVDARHNSKIRREDLSAWVTKRIGPRELQVMQKEEENQS